MSPLLKKALAGFAATKAYEKVQEARRPRQSFLRRHLGKIALIGVAGGATAYLYRSGRLDALTGGGRDEGYGNEYAPGPGTEPISTPEGARTLEPTGV